MLVHQGSSELVSADGSRHRVDGFHFFATPFAPRNTIEERERNKALFALAFWTLKSLALMIHLL
jgi:hypothetical protein